jgi:DNA-binding MarR family transcriptional regulator
MHDLRANAHRLMSLFERMRHHTKGPAFAQISALNLSPSHLRVLHLLAPTNTWAMKDLAEQLGLTPPSLTAITRRLVQTGLVQRQTHPDDSRISLLSLTEAGRALHEQLYAEHLARMEQLLAGLTAEEQRLFLDLLDRAIGQ